MSKQVNTDNTSPLNTTLRAAFRFLPSTRTLPPPVCTAKERIFKFIFAERIYFCRTNLFYSNKFN